MGENGSYAQEHAQNVVVVIWETGGSLVPGTTTHHRSNMDIVEIDSDQTSKTRTRKGRGECRTLEDLRGAVERVNFLSRISSEVFVTSSIDVPLGGR